jgi:pimeloyl-ACP methyl ester carboxylesterase
MTVMAPRLRGVLGLATEDAGEGTPVVLLHGLTATRRYVVMGSKALERSGHRVVAYDARGHGDSPPGDVYGYEELAEDLVDVLDEAGLDRAVLAGASMGAHTALRLALDEPDRVAGLVVVTPGYDPAEHEDAERLARWDALAAALRDRGVDGFVAAYGEAEHLPEAWRDTVLKVVRQRLSQHLHPHAVADALEQVPRARPFPSLDALADVSAPTVVVASRDEADPGHPLALGEAYAAAIPGARLVVEEPGRSPLAWQGGQLSKVIAELAASVSRAG